MYAHIKGLLDFVHNDYIVIEAGGVGYKIYTSLSTIGSLPPVGQEVKLHTYLYVREDIMNLYGFRTQEELSMFELLISVSGVGPKAAISVISAVPASHFGLAVITGDVKALTRAQGIGNKMAQRIILELKDKIKKEQLTKIKDTDTAFMEEGSLPEAVSALVVLGYTPNEAAIAVEKVRGENLGVEEVIKQALKNLAR